MAGDGEIRGHRFSSRPPTRDAEEENRRLVPRPVHPRFIPIRNTPILGLRWGCSADEACPTSGGQSEVVPLSAPSRHPEPPLRGSGLVSDEWRALTPRGDFGHSPATLHRSVLTKALAYACRRRRLTKPSAPTRSRPIVPGSGTVEAPTKPVTLLPPLKEPRASPPEKVTVDPAPMLSEPSV